MGKGRKRTKTTYEQAIEALPKAERDVAEASLRYTEAYEAAMAALMRVNAVVANEGKALARLRSRRDQLRGLVDTGEGSKPVIVSEQVDNPYLTNGLRDGAAEGDQATPFIKADKNMMVLIGGFARISDRTEEQTLAAAKLRILHERAQLGGAKALDYGQVRVDTSGPTEEAVAEIGARARKEYMDAVQELGMLQSSVVERVVIHDMSLRELAATLELGDSGGARKAAKRQLFEAVNHLVEHFGLRAGAGARHRNRKWNDGSELKPPSEIAEDHVQIAA